MQGGGGPGSSVIFKLQLRASLSLGSLAREPMGSLAWKKCVDATPYASGNVNSLKMNAEAFFFVHPKDARCCPRRKPGGPVSL